MDYQIIPATRTVTGVVRFPRPEGRSPAAVLLLVAAGVDVGLLVTALVLSLSIQK